MACCIYITLGPEGKWLFIKARAEPVWTESVGSFLKNKHGTQWSFTVHMAVWKGWGLWGLIPDTTSYYLGGLGQVTLCICALVYSFVKWRYNPNTSVGCGKSPSYQTPSTLPGIILLCSCYVSSLLGTNQWLALTGVCPTPQLHGWEPTLPRGQEREVQGNTGHQVGEVSIPFLAKHRFAAGKPKRAKEWLWPRLLCFIANSLCLDYNKAFFLLSLPCKPWTVPDLTAWAPALTYSRKERGFCWVVQYVFFNYDGKLFLRAARLPLRFWALSYNQFTLAQGSLSAKGNVLPLLVNETEQHFSVP